MQADGGAFEGIEWNEEEPKGAEAGEGEVGFDEESYDVCADFEDSYDERAEFDYFG